MKIHIDDFYIRSSYEVNLMIMDGESYDLKTIGFSNDGVIILKVPVKNNPHDFKFEVKYVQDKMFLNSYLKKNNIVAIVIIVLYLLILTISCKDYKIKGDYVVVYSGILYRYVKHNNIIKDKNYSIYLFNNKPLSYIMDDGTKIEVEISNLNCIKLRMDGTPIF